MTKIQPHGEIGPNNAGKMIIRGICFSSGIEKYPDLKRQIDDYLDARGTVGPIKLSKTVSEVDFSAEEAEFISTLIEKLRKLEFAPEEIAAKNATHTRNQRDAMVKLVEDELEKFLEAQSKKDKEVCFTGVAYTIIENVKSRTAVSYADTRAWEDSIELQEPSGNVDLFAGMTIHDQSKGSYTPPPLDPVHIDPVVHDEIDEEDEEVDPTFGVGFQSMFFKQSDADKVQKAIENMVDNQDEEKQADDEDHTHTPSTPTSK